MVHRDQVGSIRLIPAHARKTSAFIDETAGTSAHLCSHGENPKVIRQVLPRNGSSPLTRGKHLVGARHPSRERLIPAHARKTLTPGSCPSDTSAHPRSHGENAVAARMDRQQIGSSPLTRGKRVGCLGCRRDRGLIPAHAGKTSSEPLSLASRPAHPHSRRENRPMTIVRPIHTDSSPLTRGKRIRLASTRSHFRLIPAHAGKTLEKTLAREPSGAHPRSRGENISSRSAIWFLRGSSPLTRGKPRRSGSRRPSLGLIPAHAGKTCPALSTGSGRRAHPRSRGENVLPRLPSADFAGSSPLTRGKPAALRAAWLRGRLIPAHAGKTTRATLSEPRA